MESFSEGAEPEAFLVIGSDQAIDIASLVQAIDVLQTGHPVPLKLHRNPAVLLFLLFITLFIFFNWGF